MWPHLVIICHVRTMQILLQDLDYKHIKHLWNGPRLSLDHWEQQVGKLSRVNNLETLWYEFQAIGIYQFIGPRVAIWRHRSGSTPGQVMACCLTSPNHYLNQCWVLISGVLFHSQSYLFCNKFDDLTKSFQIIATSHRSQWVKVFSPELYMNYVDDAAYYHKHITMTKINCTITSSRPSVIYASVN